MRSAENELDNFWHLAEIHFEEKAGISLHGLLQSILGHRKLQRTLEWSEPLPIFRTAPPQIDEVTTSGLTSSLEERTESTLISEETLQTKVKAKTRGIALVPMLSDMEIDDDDPMDAVLTSKFKVGKRASRVFSTLFGRPTEEGIPGELPWKEFLYAMTSLGFSVQKLDGSAWIFSPVDEPLERSITFHEPHPVSKIPFRVARRYGRRLEWAYGWTADSFVRA
ncbi:hypothetical protein MMC28_003429 [Mycoblastus sanguinarius]|nr:hypothetical protein [Mycoblastus sanguinarius]